jgi:hypothetical protein
MAANVFTHPQDFARAAHPSGGVRCTGQLLHGLPTKPSLGPFPSGILKNVKNESYTDFLATTAKDLP